MSYLSCLQFSALGTVDVDGVLAWECEKSDFVVEQQTIFTQFFFGYSVGTFDVCITLAGHRIASVSLLTMAIVV